MEYLMTYGWSILIIAVVLGALAYLGVFNPNNFAPRAPTGSCKVFKVGGNINLEGICNGELPQYVAQVSGGNGYISKNSPNNLPSSAITVSAWVYITGGSAEYDVVDTMTGPWTGAFDLDANIGGSGCNNQAFVVGNGVATGTSYYGSTCQIGVPTGAWEFIAGTYNGATIISYIDGTAGPTVSYSGAISYSNSYCGSLRIGQRCDGSANFVNGMIADVQIYNSSLDANTIAALYKEGIGGAPVSPQYLVGWWPLNGDANDYSGNNNNGASTAVSYTNQWLSGYAAPSH